MRMQLRSCLVLAMAALCLAKSPIARAVDLYVLSNNYASSGSPSTNFGRIDSTTGNYTSIATFASDLGNLAWNPIANNFFVTEDSATATNLRTLTKSGTLSNSLGNIGTTIVGMALRPSNSTLYGYDYQTDKTGTINTADGSWSPVSSIGKVGLSDLSGRLTILNDTIYLDGAFVPSQIGTIGYTASSTFQSLTSGDAFYYLNLANDGTTLYGVFGDQYNTKTLYTINPGTGALTAGPAISGAGLGMYFHGAAVAIASVPEPSTYALAAIATGVMAAVARRRKARKA